MKSINNDKHCSECIWYEPCANFYMYCRYLKRKITARKTPKYCKGYKYMYDSKITEEQIK